MTIPKMIIVAGPPGSGKSSVYPQIGKNLHHHREHLIKASGSFLELPSRISQSR